MLTMLEYDLYAPLVKKLHFASSIDFAYRIYSSYKIAKLRVKYKQYDKRASALFFVQRFYKI